MSRIQQIVCDNCHNPIITGITFIGRFLYLKKGTNPGPIDIEEKDYCCDCTEKIVYTMLKHNRSYLEMNK